MNRFAYAVAVTVVGLGIAGAMTLRGQTPGALNARAGVALHGYDVVAYFDGHATEGQRAYESTWRGVTWRFASAANRDRFQSAPDAFVPQFGGFCAYGVSRGYAVDIDPAAFSIVDGKLYLNYSKTVQRAWSQDPVGYIRRARDHWPKLASELEKE